MRKNVMMLFAAMGLMLASGCMKRQYVTPGGGINLAAIEEKDIREHFLTKAASNFPARILTVRLQQSGYYSHGNEGHGGGAFSVLTVRDIESDEHFDALENMPQVAGLGPVGRILLPNHFSSIKDLRIAAAKLHADMLLLYTIDTSFRVRGQSLGPLSVITLGFLPNKKAYVTATASAVFVDVRTGYYYGLAEASHTANHLANTWTKEKAIDKARLDAEKAAFGDLILAIEKTWNGILKEYADKITDKRIYRSE